MPGNASGGMDGIALKPLTVSFSEPGFVSKLNQENQFGPWFTLSDKDQQQLGSPMGYTDPSGHWVGSITIGYSHSWFSWAGTGSIGVSFDGEGNIAVSLNGGGGGTTSGAGASVGVTAGVSFDAPNIDAVGGWSTVVGGSGGAGPVAGGDIAFSKKADGGYYHMGSVTAGAGMKVSGPGLPAEGHVLGVYTDYSLGRMNIKDLEHAYNNFEQEATQYFRNLSGVSFP